MRLIQKTLSEKEQYTVEEFTVKKDKGVLYISKNSSNFEPMKKTNIYGNMEHAISDGHRLYVLR